VREVLHDLQEVVQEAQEVHVHQKLDLQEVEVTTEVQEAQEVLHHEVVQEVQDHLQEVVREVQEVLQDHLLHEVAQEDHLQRVEAEEKTKRYYIL